MNIGEFKLNHIYNIDAIEGMKRICNNSIQCVVTSPPYWGLRDYNYTGQFGLEETPEKYVDNLVNVFSEVKRIIKSDGTMWLNLGDTYYSKGSALKHKGYPDLKYLKGRAGEFKEPQTKPHKFLKPKDMVGIPWRVAFALQKELGLYLRQAIIWYKPNAMPSGVKDRPLTDYEFIFLLSKSEKYYYNYKSYGSKIKNCRAIWTFNTQPFKGNHFGVFPEKLPEKCIKMGTQKGDIVLDPFIGIGTTAIVAKKMKRNYIGFDINVEYVKIAKQRIKEIIDYVDINEFF